MAKEMAALHISIAKLHTDHSPSTSQKEQKSKQAGDPAIKIVQFDLSQRTIILSATFLRQRREDKWTQEIMVCLDKLSLNELYQLQHETQLELCDREALVHNELQLVSEDKEHYVEECIALWREKEEVEKVYSQLKEEKQEMEQVSSRMKAEKEQVDKAFARLKTIVTEVMTEVTEHKYQAD